MAASLRVLRRRIKSTKNIAQITKAMEMVAASRISKAQARVEAARPYSDEFTHVLTTAAKAGASDHPLLVAREEPARVGVLVVTSDRGLAGGYNAGVLREAERTLSAVRDDGKEPVLFVIGGKGETYFRFRKQEIAASWTGFSEVPDYASASHAADTMTACFLTGGEATVERPSSDDDAGSGSEGSSEGSSSSSRSSGFVPPEDAEGLDGVDELLVVFTEFTSMASQTVKSRQIAPLQLEEDSEESESSNDSGASGRSGGEERQAEYEFEPEPEVLFDRLMPKYIRARVFAALLDAAASESAARQRAMKAATDNANDLVDTLTRQSNQARQAQITQEISEIVSGSDALAQ